MVGMSASANIHGLVRSYLWYRKQTKSFVVSGSKENTTSGAVLLGFSNLQIMKCKGKHTHLCILHEDLHYAEVVAAYAGVSDLHKPAEHVGRKPG